MFRTITLCLAIASVCVASANASEPNPDVAACFGTIAIKGGTVQATTFRARAGQVEGTYTHRTADGKEETRTGVFEKTFPQSVPESWPASSVRLFNGAGNAITNRSAIAKDLSSPKECLVVYSTRSVPSFYRSLLSPRAIIAIVDPKVTPGRSKSAKDDPFAVPRKIKPSRSGSDDPFGSSSDDPFGE